MYGTDANVLFFWYEYGSLGYYDRHKVVVDINTLSEFKKLREKKIFKISRVGENEWRKMNRLSFSFFRESF
jgi:hypothetical protein